MRKSNSGEVGFTPSKYSAYLHTPIRPRLQRRRCRGACWDRDAVDLHPAGGRLGRRAVRAAFLFQLAFGAASDLLRVSTISAHWVEGVRPPGQLVTMAPPSVSFMFWSFASVAP